MRLGFAMLVPAWHAPDEYAHYWVIERLATTRSFPLSSPEFPAYEAYQPPLYYVVAAGLFGALTAGATFSPEPALPGAGLLVLRLLSVLAGVLTVLFAYRFFAEIRELSRADRLLATLFSAFLPTFVGLTATVNNDAFVVLFSTLCLYFAVKQRGERRAAFWSGFWAGMALLTKMNALILIPVVLLLVLRRQDAPGALRLRWAVVFLSAWAVGAALLAVRNFMLYGHVLVLNPGAPMQWHFSFSSLIWALRNLAWSFWFAFGRTYEVVLPAPVYVIVVGLFLLFALAGWKNVLSARSALPGNIFFAVSIATFASLYYTFSYPPGAMTSWGKNLYPVLVFAALFFAIGWNAVSNDRLKFFPFAAVVLFIAGDVLAVWMLL